MTPMTPAIRAEGVCKSFRIPLDRPATLKHRLLHPRSTSRYRRFHALQDVSFDVAPGEFLGIIGHNGCGKSTLLKILSGIYQADGGEVSVVGRISPFLELGVGFNPELTARENVFLSGSVLGLTRRELDERVDHIIDFADIGEFSETKLKNFSSGMQVRLAFSVAIQVDAQVLLMDEVLAVGDASFQEKCFDVFSEYKRQGKTIVLVTHDLVSVLNYCDRCILLDHGKLIADGGPSEVTARYRRMVGAGRDHVTEADAADAGMAADLVRYGSREIAISHVRLLDGDGGEHTVFTTDSPMTVEIEYEVHDDAPGAFVAGLTFERTDGVQLASPSTAPIGLIIACAGRGSRGVVRYTMDSLPLLAAAYHLHVGISDRHAGHTFDRIERAATFRVVDERSRGGMIEPHGRWETAELGDGTAAAAANA